MFCRTLAIGAVLVFSGCANLTTYQADIGTPTTGVSFDAKQRLLLVGNRNKDGTRPVCAEPSPDALSSIGASLGASFFSQAGASKNLSAALGESAASVGLRTTSIQLLRDAMYRACEAYLFGGIDDGAYMRLQAHSQNLFVGLLAIEQLTGAVQAQQVAVLSNASAGSLSDASKEARALAVATDEAQAAEAAAHELTNKAALAQQAVAAKQSSLDSAKSAKPADPEAVKALDADLKKLKAESQEAGQQAKAASQTQADKADAQALAKASYNTARSKLHANVEANAKFSDSYRRGDLSGANAAILTQGVVKIVQSVMDQSIASQRCTHKITHNEFTERPVADRQLVLDYCTLLQKLEAKRGQKDSDEVASQQVANR